jgi:hypothetical protein
LTASKVRADRARRTAHAPVSISHQVELNRVWINVRGDPVSKQTGMPPSATYRYRMPFTLMFHFGTEKETIHTERSILFQSSPAGISAANQ